MKNEKSEIRNPKSQIELILPCTDLAENLRFFTERLGFAVEVIFPADDPRVAVISGYGMRLRLERAAEEPEVNGNIRLRLNLVDQAPDGEIEVSAPNGVRIEFCVSDPPLVVPELKPAFVLSKFNEESAWVSGRAGMRYRDLIPDRLGGRFIASHIHIPTAGPVPDYVHFHKIWFQIIYCLNGSARLVYEDQGEPFLLRAGDCVLQPPRIRHRVLESSADLEVIEVGCPAEHETRADPEMILPTNTVDPDRDFGGQRFVRSVRSADGWEKWRVAGFECLDTGIGAATKGLADVRTVRSSGSPDTDYYQHTAELFFLFILRGRAVLKRRNEAAAPLGAGDALVIPAGMDFSLTDCSDGLEMLEVTLPEEFATIRNGS